MIDPYGRGVFIDPTTDPGFKILFGREDSKDILIDLLNTLLDLKGDERIEDLQFRNGEKQREQKDERSVIFDLQCRSNNGKRFIVEMQTCSQVWFVERCLLYVSRAITEQSRAGKWNYEYEPVIGIAFTTFPIPRLANSLLTDALLTDRYSGKPITDHLRLMFIQLPEFDKTDPEECKTALEQWLYTIKNMKNMETIPFATVNPIFRRVEEVGRMANLSRDEMHKYESELKAYRDYYSTISFAREQGLEAGFAEGEAKGLAKGLAKGEAKGRLEEKAELVRQFYNQGVELEVISKATNLTIPEIKKLIGL